MHETLMHMYLHAHLTSCKKHKLISTDAGLHNVNTAHPKLSKFKNSDLNSMQNVQWYETKEQ